MKKRKVLPRKRIAITAIVLAGFLIFSASLTAYAMNVRTVLIVDDGEQTVVNTTRSSWNDILRARGVTLDNDDYLDLSSFSPTEDGVIRIHRAKRVTLVDDGVPQQLTAAGSVQRLLELQGVDLAERDQLNYQLRDILTDGMEVVISRAFDILVRDYGRDFELTLTEGSVAQALELAGLTLEGEDFVEPEADAALEPGMTIEVMRVVYRERERVTAIDFEVERRNNANLDLGVNRVEQQGVRGEKRIVYSDRYVNGERVESTVVEEEIVTPPVPEIRVVGTRTVRLSPGVTPISTLAPPPGLIIENGRPTNMVRQVHVGTATAYTYYGQGITATGVPARLGHVAVDPRIIPYGSHLWIVSNDGRYVYGYAIAVDTGGFVRHANAPIVDVYVPNSAFARQWGRRAVTVYVLDIPRARLPWNQTWNAGEVYSHRIARR